MTPGALPATRCGDTDCAASITRALRPEGWAAACAPSHSIGVPIDGGITSSPCKSLINNKTESKILHKMTL